MFKDDENKYVLCKKRLQVFRENFAKGKVLKKVLYQ